MQHLWKYFQRVLAENGMSALGALSAILVVALGVLMYSLTLTPHRTVAATSLARVHDIDAQDHIIGRLDAPVQLIVFFNPDCPYCRHLHDVTVPKLLQEFGDNIVVAYRYMYIPEFPNSEKEMEAIECAFAEGGIEKYRLVLQAFFAAEAGSEGLSTRAVDEIGQNVGLDLTSFRTCIESGKTKLRVNRDVAEAANAAMIYTPTTVVRSKTQSLVIDGENYAHTRTAVEFLLAHKN